MRDELFFDGDIEKSSLQTSHEGSGPAATEGWEEPRSKREYPTFESLQQDVQAIVAQVDTHSSAKSILMRASDLLKASIAHLDFKRPDVAWVKYIAASQILLYLVPRNREYPTLRAENGSLNQIYNDLLMKVKNYEETFLNVKHILKTAAVKSDTDVNNNTVHPPLSDSILLVHNGAVKQKPLVQPKPQNLAGNSLTIHTGNGSRAAESAPIDPLATRFAQLRSSGQKRQTLQSNSQERREEKMQEEPLRMPSPADFIPIQRPAGPREMPKNSTTSQAPIVPPKVPIDTHSSMPRPPSPTYSPAFSSSQTIVNHTRDSERSGLTSKIYHTSANGPDDAFSDSSLSDRGSFVSGQINGGRSSWLNGPGGIKNPQAADLGPISVQNLHSHLRHAQNVDVLLIDLRSRSNFDQGHIFSRSVICIEPVILREGLSAEQIEDALVVSPEAETRLFSDRHKFDQVILYDQQSTMLDWERRSRHHEMRSTLENIVESLTIYNYAKPLKRKLLLLDGGLDAWTDYVGPQALQISRSTEAAFRGTNSRPKQNGGTLEGMHESSQIQNNNTMARMSTDYHSNGQTKLYQQVVPRQARGESDLSQVKQARRQAAVISNDDNMAYIQTYEDFLRRYPEASSIQESMVAPAPRPYHSNINQITTFPSNEALPQHQASNAPSRPPPAVPRTSYSGVSEHGPLRTTAHLRPPKYNSKFPCPRSKIGLRNYGNTCYMNAVIQCLNAPGPLAAWALEYASSAPNFKSKLAKAYVELVDELYRSGSSVRKVEPSKLRHYVRLGNADFDNSLQHDAQDFFSWFINQLHTDFNVNAKRSQLAPLTEAQEEKRERIPPRLASKLEWIRYLHNDNSYINKLFRGQTSSLLQCPECRNHSTTYEPFMGLPLQISHHQDSVQQSLERFRAVETLKGNDLWKCPKCKRNREAHKQVFITRAPRILVLELMRYEKRMGRPTEKLQTKVSFPLDLDITNSVLRPEPLTTSLANDIVRELGQDTLDLMYEPEIETMPPYRYRLYAVARHKGATPSSGHYTAVIYNPKDDRWWEYDDERVYACSPETLQNNQAYLLFYMRSNMNEENL